MNKPLFDIDRSGMQVEVNSYKPGDGFVWGKLFPLKYTPKFDLKGIEGNEGIPVSADRVAFNTKSPKKTRKNVGSWSGTLGKISISREKNEREINEYRDLQTLAANNTEDVATARYLVDMVYDDVKFCAEGMDAKVEIDAMRIGSSGVQTFPASIEGDMATEDVINFNVPKTNFRKAAVNWSDVENADALKDIADAQTAIAKLGLKKPQFAIMEKTAWDKLTAQKATARRMFPRYDQALVTADMIDLEAVNSFMRGKGYPQILVIDTYSTIEDKNGNQTTIKPWDENVVTLAPTAQLGWTYYKPVPSIDNVDALQVQGSYYKTTRYSDVNPMVEVTMAEAYVQCGLINRASLVFLKADGSNW